MYKNVILFIVCLFINLLIGNIVLYAFLMDTPIVYRFLISFGVISIYSFSFFAVSRQKQKPKRRTTILISTITSLASMLVACIFISIAMRLPFDTVITAGLKGILPMFVFALVLASPIWITIAICNFLCFNNLKYP